MLFSVSTLAIAASLVSGAFATDDTTAVTLQSSTSSNTCRLLRINAQLVGKVSYSGNSVYEFEQSKYWSQFQALQSPWCRVTPTSASDVSVALKIIRAQGTLFSVKSGGHAAMAGASNNDGGIVIDLSGLNKLVVAKDKTSVVFGSGLRWVNVYQQLDPLGITVLGGRVSDIGSGGLTLGGGLSFFSNRGGWVSDGIINFEVVLADGSIVNANSKTNADLWWSLKGGGNNFGIVTAFTAKAMPQGNLWAGSRLYLSDLVNQTVWNAFVSISNDMQSDPNAHLILAQTLLLPYGRLAAVDFDYALPNPFPKIYRDSGLRPLVPLIDSMRITTLTDLTLEFNSSNPGGFQQIYGTATFTLSVSMLEKLSEIFYSNIEPIYAQVSGFTPALVLQPISKALLLASAAAGGNPLGFEAGEGPFILMSLSVQWADPANNALVLATQKKIVAQMIAYGKQVGQLNEFVYQNYATLDQKPFVGYGVANRNKLIAVANKYDPCHVFQTLQPGYFKL